MNRSEASDFTIKPPDRSYPLERFSTLATINGDYEVIDTVTGRAVAQRETRRSANGVVWRLNDAAKLGPNSLARAFGRVFYDHPG